MKKSPRSVSELTEQALDIPSNSIVDDSGFVLAYFFDFLGKQEAALASEHLAADVSGGDINTRGVPRCALRDDARRLKPFCAAPRKTDNPPEPMADSGGLSNQFL